jgi:hypothetical protein
MPDVTDLAEVLPFEQINARFAGRVIREELRKADLDEINRQCRSDMFSLAINCAIRAKQFYKPDLDMAPLVPQIQQGDPAVLGKLTAMLKEDALADIYCCRCTIEGQLVSSLLIAQVWPRDLYIGMITFADPSKPIPPEERKSVLQKFQGLGLLPTFLKRVESCAVARGCKNITLIANESSQSGLFGRFGFTIDDHPGAKQAVNDGRAIPMHKTIAGR